MVLGIGDAEIFHSLKLWNWQANLRAADRQEAWTSPIDKKNWPSWVVQSAGKFHFLYKPGT